jgi:uncharacterized membrane protein YbhN (UPF0104 family)
VDGLHGQSRGDGGVKRIISPLLALGRHRSFQVVVSLAIGILLLWLAFARVDLRSLAARLSQIEPKWLALAMIVYWIALSLRSWRWRIILAPARKLDFGQVFQALIIGYAANNVLPARVGELLRADYVGRRYGVPRLSVIGTIVVERLFDVIVFLGFIFAGLAALHLRGNSDIGRILHIVEILAVGCGLLLAGLLVLVNVRHMALPAAFAFLDRHRKSLTDGLHLITGAPEVVMLTAATVVVWSADSFSVWLLCKAIHVDLSLLALLFVMGMACLAALIPAAPANIGALQFAMGLAFPLLGLSKDSGIALSLLFQGCFILSSTLVGGILYLAGAFNAAARRVDSRPGQ